MITYEDGKEIDTKAEKMPKAQGGEYLCVLEYSELDVLENEIDFKQKLIDGSNPDECASKYENHDGYDMIHINVPDELEDKNSVQSFGAYIAKGKMVCMYSSWKNENTLPLTVKNCMNRSLSNQRTLLTIIDMITKNDADTLGKLEDGITNLEDDLVDSEVTSGMEQITVLRRKLQPMKRFYEQLLDTLEDMEEDENDIFSETDIKYCRRIKNRVDRLYHTVINLRDYITQVREAYQAQIDIGLNNVMKVFTVITAVFLPLTLLAGWYGMNLKMPEFDWEHGYLFVVGMSIAIVAACIIIFKKKKWF